MTSCASLPCSATSGKIAAHLKKPIAGFSGSSDKQQGVLLELSQLAEYSAHGQFVLPSTLVIGQDQSGIFSASMCSCDAEQAGQGAGCPERRGLQEGLTWLPQEQQQT